MSNNATKPSVIRDKDVLNVKLTGPGESRLIFQLLNDVNSEFILVRSVDYFAVAASDNRLVHVEVERTKHVIAAMSFVPPEESADETPPSEEVANIIVHPEARGFAVATRLVQAAMIHRLGQDIDTDERAWFAKVLATNMGPDPALTAAGFEKQSEPILLNPDDFGGAIDHMLVKGETHVKAEKYVFDAEAFDRLVYNLRDFIREGGSVTKSDVTIYFDFSGLIDRTALEAHP